MLQTTYHNKIEEANLLINNLKINLALVYGLEKLIRRIKTEILVLEKAHSKGTLKEENIQCSNLGHLGAVSNVAISTQGVVAVLKPFKLLSGRRIICDIVGNNGASWYKVILRNPKALHHIYVSGNKNATRPLHEIAKNFLDAASNNLFLFKPPTIIFVLVSGISESLAKKLKSLGIIIKGEIIPDADLHLPNYCDSNSDSSQSCPSDTDDDETSELLSSDEDVRKLEKCFSDITLPASTLNHISRVNLDVTALIAYVSSTTNGHCHFKFFDEFLSEQASWERASPVKKQLENYFRDRELLLCEEAAEHFKTIVKTIGGSSEQKRGDEILEKCKIIPSLDIFKDQLAVGGRVKELSRKIFGTGHSLKAPTVTSNRGFVRSALNKGIRLGVLHHGPRALTELKESTAIPLSDQKDLENKEL